MSTALSKETKQLTQFADEACNRQTAHGALCPEHMDSRGCEPFRTRRGDA